MRPKERDMLIARKSLKGSNVASEIERKRVQAGNRRPNQARFRRAVLGERPRRTAAFLPYRPSTRLRYPRTSSGPANIQARQPRQM